MFFMSLPIHRNLPSLTTVPMESQNERWMPRSGVSPSQSRLQPRRSLTIDSPDGNDYESDGSSGEMDAYLCFSCLCQFTKTYQHLLQFPWSPRTSGGCHDLECPLPNRKIKVSILMLLSVQLSLTPTCRMGC